MNMIFQVLEREPRRPTTIHREIPKDLEIICMKCLFKEPELRYQSAAELADDLTRYLSGEAIQARRATLAYRAGKKIRRHKVAVCIASILLLTVVCFTVYLIFDWYKQDFIPTAVQNALLKQYQPDERGIVSFVQEYLSPSDQEFIRSHSPKIKYLKYDWALNEQ